MAILIKAKEILVQQSIFPQSLTIVFKLLVILIKSAHIKIPAEVGAQALVMTQAITKIVGQRGINLKILPIIQRQNKAKISSMAYHTIRLGYHFKEQKKA